MPIQPKHTPINMEIKRIGSQPSSKGPADWFTGTVRIDPLFQPNAPARASGASVTFEPGARTAWHTHPLGQTLIVIAGCGWAQQEGGPVEEIQVTQALANEPETMRAVMKEIPIGDLVTLRKSPPSFFGRAVQAQGIGHAVVVDGRCTAR